MASIAEDDTNQEEHKKMLWGGRFKSGLDPIMELYNRSIGVDRVLWREDIDGSKAWARANKSIGILTDHECSEIERGLETVAGEWRTGSFTLKPSDEDIYTANERRLGEIIGQHISGKLHTGRSRNEQSSADQRLWACKALDALKSDIKAVLEIITSRAEKEIDHIMPGYTHLQRAQPVRWSHFLLSHGFALAGDLRRLAQILERINISPYGSGAIAGNAFGVDRLAVANELGFHGMTWNSMQTVGDREYSLEALQLASMIMLHLSRLAEDLILYSSAEFGMVQISDAYSTGSSLMPQKKNADSLELMRGRTGEVLGLAHGLTISIKGLPSTYNKDLQGSLKALVEGMTCVSQSVKIAGGVLETLTIRPQAMLANLTPDMLATDLADYLVRKRVPFRETHHISGRVVALAEDKGVLMSSLSLDELRYIDSRFEADIMEIFDFEASVECKTGQGSTCRAAVQDQIAELRRRLI
ncbi:argininosuccinate lyase [Polychaeton citri CBS 116435]|uniref:Arginosuccinase n=1 Tax=Polychaeton citri CBS 116435 TaxID=1314669 RepID=A0A9P4UKC4_9PEZI|nr:argininosuccinate lyase [Polychaeton citri CBS 116435]